MHFIRFFAVCAFRFLMKNALQPEGACKFTKSYVSSLKQSCPVGVAGCAMMMVMITGAGVQGQFHIGRDFSTGPQMWQGFDII
ncbi:MAG TPA: hypothetical protein DEH25_10045 [Chloroflexi bacterium]|nr:hypothetical protein [Chloroflexota bacterium]